MYFIILTIAFAAIAAAASIWYGYYVRNTNPLATGPTIKHTLMGEAVFDPFTKWCTVLGALQVPLLYHPEPLMVTVAACFAVVFATVKVAHIMPFKAGNIRHTYGFKYSILGWAMIALCAGIWGVNALLPT